MFEYEQPKEKPPTDYTGLIIAAALAPVLLTFMYFGAADLGLAVDIVLGIISLVIKLRWDLRGHVWFWVTIAVVLSLHAPLFFMVSWQGKTHVRAYGFVSGITDFLIIQGAVRLAEKLFSKRPA